MKYIVVLIWVFFVWFVFRTIARSVIEAARCGRFSRACCRVKRQLFAIALMINLVFIAWPATGRAQTFTSTRNRKPDATVAVRELQISTKGRDALRKGIESLQKGDAVQSLSHFNRAIKESPNSYKAYCGKGLAEIRLQKVNDAIESFQRAIDFSDGHYAPAYFGYGQALLLLQSSKDAEAILRRGLEEDSSSSEGYTLLSILLTGEHRLNEGEEMAHNALQTHDPFAWKALVPLAYIHEQRDEYGTAVQDLESYLGHVRSEGDKRLSQQVEQRLAVLKVKADSQHVAAH